jgi:regulator of cell morphogenesis and NO signaling
MPSTAATAEATRSERTAAEGADSGARAARKPGHGLGALADHIIATHHAFLRAQLPRLSRMLEWTMAQDDHRFAELSALRDALRGLRASVESGTAKEEKVLFPLIHQLDRACRRGDRPPESVTGYLRDLSHDHRIAARTLRRLDEITRQYTVPEGASEAYRELIRELERLSEDLRRHNEKERTLIERALAAERALVAETPPRAGPGGAAPA